MNPTVMLITERVKTSVTCHEKDEAQKVNASLKAFPILKQAVLVHQLIGGTYMARHDRVSTLLPRRIIEIAELINYVNPKFPGDSFSVLTLVDLISSLTAVSPEEIKTLQELLPPYTADTRIEVIARPDSFSITFNRSMKKSGMFYSIQFSSLLGLCFPLTVKLTTYADMDEDSNHYEGCDGNNCNCEPDITFEGQTQINGEEHLKLLSTWLEKNLFQDNR